MATMNELIEYVRSLNLSQEDRNTVLRAIALERIAELEPKLQERIRVSKQLKKSKGYEPII